MSLLTYFALGLIGLYVVKYFLPVARRKDFPSLPPGPPSKPIIGNLLDLPPADSQDWQHWLKHKELYGPISSVTIFGQTLIIINAHHIAVELMEKRSALHSSRPYLPIAEITGWKDTLGLLPNSGRFRAYRKAAHREMGTATAVSKYNGILDAESHRFLLRALREPESLIGHIRKESGAVILKIAYGYTIEPHASDPLVDLVDEAMDDFSQLVLPGAWLVNFVPLLNNLPEWFPGGGFKRTAKAYKERVMAMNDAPYEFVKRQMARQEHSPSFVSNLLEQSNVEPGSEEEIVVKWTAGALYGGGADTTVSALTCFFMAMTLYPHIQKKAQEEIDQVVGTSRLPNLEDRDKLPYIDALVQEVLRWHPVTPLGVTHASTQDDIYNGYLIPKGSIIVPNIWAFTHDPSLYRSPMDFNPERFLSADGHTPEYDPRLLAFGFGRRICPGRLLADANIYLTIARSLAVFNITKAVIDGQEAPVNPKFLTGIISHPAPFDLSIKVRGSRHKELIQEVEKEHPWGESHAAEISFHIK
ncbi:hypothetical protein EYZ11_013218 [Aspergillus tanneri]|uniref:O-methylsterigmatocystin oxidoreductase n=1 Tax=Aspergillus tanneri TaxID=1220188 RepID=A0A4S3IYG7_9EURO|nr:uncharacterized protein ATNIH1004_000279 [Aspergillus tanneri]KAA8651397.1 hypothetical protein ATNIH1004_000279 [Aspergillus tanneri]THC87335.1 hypothetical protein EYZ11_013218 [Aspergillus tanneri]